VISVSGPTIVGRNPSNETGTVTGIINIDGGSFTGTDLVLGQGSGALGTIGVTDGFLQADTLTVGAGGSGSVGQTGGYVLVTKMTLGDGGEGTGEYTLAGGELNLSGGDIHISSTGSFEHSGGHLTNVGSVLNDGVYTVSTVEGEIPLFTDVLDFTQTAAGTLSIQLAGPDGFRSGLATCSADCGIEVIQLNGELRIVPSTVYSDPATRGTADDIVLIEAGNIVGAFDTVNFGDITIWAGAGEPLTIDFADEDGSSFRSHQGDGLFRNISYTATTVQLQNLLALAGDTNGDMDVDLSDYIALANNFDPVGFLGPYSWLDGNFDGDGDVDLADYNELASNFDPAGYGTTAGVPEPSSLVLLVLGALAAIGASCCRKARRTF
jgi:hypothetical protein